MGPRSPGCQLSWHQVGEGLGGVETPPQSKLGAVQTLAAETEIQMMDVVHGETEAGARGIL